MSSWVTICTDRLSETKFLVSLNLLQVLDVSYSFLTGVIVICADVLGIQWYQGKTLGMSVTGPAALSK